MVFLVLDGGGGRKKGRVSIVPEGEGAIPHFSWFEVPILALYNSIHIIFKYFIVVIRKRNY